jgi:hypothetical protein
LTEIDYQAGSETDRRSGSSRILPVFLSRRINCTRMSMRNMLIRFVAFKLLIVEAKMVQSFAYTRPGWKHIQKSFDADLPVMYKAHQSFPARYNPVPCHCSPDASKGRKVRAGSK